MPRGGCPIPRGRVFGLVQYAGFFSRPRERAVAPLPWPTRRSASPLARETAAVMTRFRLAPSDSLGHSLRSPTFIRARCSTIARPRWLDCATACNQREARNTLVGACCDSGAEREARCWDRLRCQGPKNYFGVVGPLGAPPGTFTCRTFHHIRFHLVRLRGRDRRTRGECRGLIGPTASCKEDAENNRGEAVLYIPHRRYLPTVHVLHMMFAMKLMARAMARSLLSAMGDSSREAGFRAGQPSRSGVLNPKLR